MAVFSKILLILFLILNYLPAQFGQRLNYVNELKQQRAIYSSQHKKKRDQILKNLEKAMGKLPDRLNLPNFDIKITDSIREDRFTRYTLSFLVAENERLPCGFYMEQVSLEKEL
jgi:hypothetical protein